MMKKKIGGLLLLTFSLCYGVLAWQLPSTSGLSAGGFSPRTFPMILAASGTLLSILLIIWPASRQQTSPETSTTDQPYRHLHWRPAIYLCAMMCLYAAIFPYAGFVVSTIVFLGGAMLVLGVRRPLPLFAGSVPIAILFWLVLNKGLGIYLAPGLIFQ